MIIRPWKQYRFISLFRLLVLTSVLFSLAALLLVFTPLPNLLYRVLEVPPDLQPADAIVLLGSHVYTDNLLAEDTVQRVLHASRLYRRGLADTIIITCGPTITGQPQCAEAMRTVLLETGVPATKIYLEKKSRNTRENINNTLVLMKKLKIQRALLVTSSFHMRRSILTARALGLSLLPAPVSNYEKEISSCIHRANHTLMVLRELGALTYFRIRGWI